MIIREGQAVPGAEMVSLVGTRLVPLSNVIDTDFRLLQNQNRENMINHTVS